MVKCDKTWSMSIASLLAQVVDGQLVVKDLVIPSNSEHGTRFLKIVYKGIGDTLTHLELEIANNSMIIKGVVNTHELNESRFSRLYTKDDSLEEIKTTLISWVNWYINHLTNLKEVEGSAQYDGINFI